VSSRWIDLYGKIEMNDFNGLMDDSNGLIGSDG
jgi:hypothetical protein